VLQVELVAMLFLAAVPSFVISLEGITDPKSIDLEIGVVELVATMLAALGPAAIALYLLWRDARLKAAGFERRSIGFVTGYGALGAVCCFIAVYTLALIIYAVTVAAGGDVDPVTDTDTTRFTVGVVLAGIAIAVVAGIGEEIVFRAYAISRMEEAGYRRAALFAPWAVFTVLHLYQGPLALLIIGAVGGVFVWLYRWQRSVWPVMVAHAIYDVTILLLSAATA
jgi:membrane protease YdiL (CAAX protease family)